MDEIESIGTGDTKRGLISHADLLTRFAEEHYDEVFRYCARRFLDTVKTASWYHTLTCQDKG